MSKSYHEVVAVSQIHNKIEVKRGKKGATTSSLWLRGCKIGDRLSSSGRPYIKYRAAFTAAEYQRQYYVIPVFDYNNKTLYVLRKAKG